LCSGYSTVSKIDSTAALPKFQDHSSVSVDNLVLYITIQKKNQKNQRSSNTAKLPFLIHFPQITSRKLTLSQQKEMKHGNIAFLLHLTKQLTITFPHGKQKHFVKSQQD